MSTRSFIGIRNADFTITGVYCHWDGYPGGVGATLLQCYNNEEIIRKLISFGDISSLQERIEIPEGEPHDFDNPCSGVTIFYHRDRDEDWERLKPRTYPDFLEVVKNSWYDYIYIWEPADGGKWYVGDVNYITHFDTFAGLTKSMEDVDPVIKTVTEYVPLTEKICKTDRMPSYTMEHALEIAESYCRGHPHTIYPGCKKVDMMKVFLDALEVYKDEEDELCS